jgi:hypothetical protein
VIAWDFTVTSALVAGCGGCVDRVVQRLRSLDGVWHRSSDRRHDDTVT